MMVTKTARLPAGTAAHELSRGAAVVVSDLLDRLADRYGSAEDPTFLATARALAYRELPDELVWVLEQFRETEFAAVLAVSGLPVDDVAIGPTPAHWKGQPQPRSTLREELYHMLLGSVLGYPFGWATLQEGHLVQNVLPIREQEHEQSGHGSLSTLAWHTEDGFHPYRCDYLSLMGLRNDDLVPTTVASIADVALTPRQRETLAQPRFLIRPDNEHINQRARQDKAGHDPLPSDWYDPAPAAVLFGDLARPYLRIDPYFMTAVRGDAAAAHALRAVIAGLESALVPVPLSPGVVCFIDNYRAVHGRQAFRPRYDGRDRWLKKVVLTRDLRKSRAAREDADSHVLLPTVLSDRLGGREAALAATTTRSQP
jgi:Fe(II)/alpha-ketoglutarate-dependent arginine beta-hydroxylase